MKLDTLNSPGGRIFTLLLLTALSLIANIYDVPHSDYAWAASFAALLAALR